MAKEQKEPNAENEDAGQAFGGDSKEAAGGWGGRWPGWGPRPPYGWPPGGGYWGHHGGWGGRGGWGGHGGWNGYP